MPSPLWNSKRLGSIAIGKAVAAYNLAKQHLPIPQALRFAGYVSTHNPGSSLGVRTPEGMWQLPTPEERAKRYWDGATRSKHRYATGKHGANYEVAGRRLLASAIRQHGPLHSDAEALLRGFEQGQSGVEIPLLDALQEHHPEAHELLARPATPDNPGRLQRRANAFKYTRNTMKYFRG